MSIFLCFHEEVSYIWNFSAFIVRSNFSMTYLIQKKELLVCRLTLWASSSSTRISLESFPSTSVRPFLLENDYLSSDRQSSHNYSVVSHPQHRHANILTILWLLLSWRDYLWIRHKSIVIYSEQNSQCKLSVTRLL